MGALSPSFGDRVGITLSSPHAAGQHAIALSGRLRCVTRRAFAIRSRVGVAMVLRSCRMVANAGRGSAVSRQSKGLGARSVPAQHLATSAGVVGAEPYLARRVAACGLDQVHCAHRTDAAVGVRGRSGTSSLVAQPGRVVGRRRSRRTRGLAVSANASTASGAGDVDVDRGWLLGRIDPGWGRRCSRSTQHELHSSTSLASRCRWSSE